MSAPEEKVEAPCGKCGRKMALPPALLAKNPRCMYCGGELELDEAAGAAVDAARQARLDAETLAAKKPVRLACPICERTVVCKPETVGTRQRCLYCTGPFEVPEAGEALPGGSTALLGDIPAEPGPLLENAAAGIGLDHHFAGRGGWASLKDENELALKALQWRVLRGHAGLEEAQGLAAVLADVLDADPPEGAEAWICPLPPAWAGDLIAHWVAFEKESQVRPGEQGSCVVDLVTGSHMERRSGPAGEGLGGLKDTLASAAIEAVVSAATDGRFDLGSVDLPGGSKDEEPIYQVKHLLSVTLRPAERGSAFLFSHRWTTGIEKELDPAHHGLIKEIRRGLFRLSRLVIVFKCVFGPWFGAECLHGLTAPRFSSWLRTLHPELEGYSDIYTLVEDARLRSARSRAGS